jgi:stage V sporulation protein S
MTDYYDEPYHDEDEDADFKPDLIKVSARSRSTAVAGAIAGVMRQHRFAEVQAIGAGAVNQAVKALAIARGYLHRDGIAIVCTPYFTEVDIDGQERTAVRFRVEARPDVMGEFTDGLL